jgi:hypothetical protein
MNAVISAEGALIEPQPHDGLLLGIVLSEERKDLTLLCRQEDGKDFRLVIPKLGQLRVDNFLAGNIIFRISIYEGERCPKEIVRWMYNYNQDHARQYLPKHTEEIVDGGWTMVEITTSYGCELVALSKAHADEITVSEGSMPTSG